jgi:hypothetical protein
MGDCVLSLFVGWSGSDFRLARRIVSYLRGTWGSSLRDGKVRDTVIWSRHLWSPYDCLCPPNSIPTYENLDSRTLKNETHIPRHAR